MQENSFQEERKKMSDEDLEKEVYDNVQFAENHEASLPIGIQEGPGSEEWNALYDRDEEFGNFLEGLSETMEELKDFSLIALQEVVKGKIHSHPHHLRLLTELFKFYEHNKATLRELDEEFKK